MPITSIEQLYQYAPLPHSRSIRLLEFEPFSRSSELCVRLRVVDLDHDCPEYQTLSYTWDAPFNMPASVEAHAVDALLSIATENGVRELPIKRNLLEFVRQLHLGGFDGLFWTDAISINQASTPERVSQVMLMGRIYAQARRVFAWIGKADEYREDVWWFHDVLWERLRSSENVLSPSDTLTTESLARGLDLEDPMDKWPSLFHFYMHCRYFARAWIAQEIILSPEIVVLYGPHQIRWASLVGLNEFCRMSNLSSFFYTPESQQAAGSGAAAELKYLDDLRQSHVQGGPDTEPTLSLLTRVYGAQTYRERRCAYFEWVLTHARRFEATIPHDQVCSVIGILNLYLPDDSLIVPRYGTEPAQFYTCVVKQLLSVAQSLTILSLVEDPSIRQTSDLPSWVPEFSARHNVEVAHLWFPQRLACLQGLHGVRNWKINEKRLEVQAYCFSNLSHIGSSTKTSQDNSQTGRTLMQTGEMVDFIGSHLRMLNHMHAKYADGHPALHALICALEASMTYEDMDERVTTFRSLVETVLAAYMKKVHDREESDVQVETHPEPLDQTLDLLDDLSLPGLPTRHDVEEYYRVLCISPECRSFDEEQKCQEVEIARSVFGSTIARIQDLRRTVLTEKGYVGLGPISSRVHDEVWLIQGARVPFILRRTPEGCYKLIGEAFIHGIMQGELVPDITVQQFQEIEII